MAMPRSPFYRATMGRQRRPYLPGAIFHLTARTLRREHRFTPQLRRQAMQAIARSAERARVRPLAVAIMSNHLHVVVQQGHRPLAALMQPLLRRLAVRIQESHGLEGPVFWRPYASQACLDPSHVRNAIVYTHLNPVRAGVCDDPADYPWTSHALYAQASGVSVSLEPLAGVLDPAIALPLFAYEPDRSTAQLRQDYQAFVAWRQQADRTMEADAPDSQEPEPPPSRWASAGWGGTLSPLFHAPARRGAARENDHGRPPPWTPDLAALARATLAAEAPGATIDGIRGRRGGGRAVELRHTVIRRLHAAGFRNVEIARFIGLSESAISYVLCRTQQPKP